MTAREIEIAMRAGIPFVVYGEAVWFDPKQYHGEWPHAVYRRLMGNGDIAVEVESAQEHSTRVPGLIPVPADSPELAAADGSDDDRRAAEHRR